MPADEAGRALPCLARRPPSLPAWRPVSTWPGASVGAIESHDTHCITPNMGAKVPQDFCRGSCRQTRPAGRCHSQENVQKAPNQTQEQHQQDQKADCHGQSLHDGERPVQDAPGFERLRDGHDRAPCVGGSRCRSLRAPGSCTLWCNAFTRTRTRMNTGPASGPARCLTPDPCSCGYPHRYGYRLRQRHGGWRRHQPRYRQQH